MKKILIVEDDKFLANAYRVKLTREGFEAKIATDGEDALKQMKDYVPDLILLDLVMPKKDGFATLQELRANDHWKKIPVILASNLGQNEDIQKGKDLGANDFIIKSDMYLKDVVTKIRTLTGESEESSTTDKQ